MRDHYVEYAKRSIVGRIMAGDALFIAFARAWLEGRHEWIVAKEEGIPKPSGIFYRRLMRKAGREFVRRALAVVRPCVDLCRDRREISRRMTLLSKIYKSLIASCVEAIESDDGYDLACACPPLQDVLSD